MTERWSRVKNDNETLAANAEFIWGPQLDERIMRVKRRGFRRQKKRKHKKQECFRCQGQFCCDGAGREALTHCTGRCAPLNLEHSRLASAEQNYFSIHPWPRKLLNPLRVCVLGDGALPEMGLWALILFFWYYPPSIKSFPLAFNFFFPWNTKLMSSSSIPRQPQHHYQYPTQRSASYSLEEKTKPFRIPVPPFHLLPHGTSCISYNIFRSLCFALVPPLPGMPCTLLHWANILLIL